MYTPPERGPLSAWVRTVLTSATDKPAPEVPVHDDPGSLLRDQDFQLALWTCYQLHHTGFDDVPSDAEWNQQVLAFRAQLERPFEEAVRAVALPAVQDLPHAPLQDQLRTLLDEARRESGPGLSHHLQRRATFEEVQDFMRRRSVYHLKESDSVSFLLPRLTGRAKVALAELQYDEYGAGDPARLHQQLFADALVACDLSPRPGAYLADADALTLAADNVWSLLCLHRRLRGMAVGHLAAFEATSSLPCRRIADGMRRLGLPAAAVYFDEHVEADAVHEQVALVDICGALVEEEPVLFLDVLTGAALCLAMDDLVGGDLLERWQGEQRSYVDDGTGAA